jgi:cbb3-type cytochrome c oxidase subunit III
MMCPGCALWSRRVFCGLAFGVKFMSFSHVIAFAALVVAGLGSGLTQAADTPAPAAAPVAATPPAEAVASAADAPVKPGDATAGQAKSATCAACHGMDGNPASSQYPKLAGQHEEYIARQVDMFKSHKRDSAVMMGFVMGLSAQDMHDIGAYFASKTSLPGVADAKLVQRGEAIYRGGDKNANAPACMACHGPDGRGNPGAGYPQLAGQYADYVTLKLKEWHDGKTWGDDDRAKVMPAVAKGLSDADIAALASYIEGLHAADANSTAAK